MRCILTVALLIVSFAGSLVAQTVSPIPEKRLVYSKDIDFYGARSDEPLRYHASGLREGLPEQRSV